MQQANPCGAGGRGLLAQTDGRRRWTASGNVPNAYWNRVGEQANVDRNDPENRNPNDGVRSAVEGQGAVTDFSQPPSILPISSIASCAWKILVSFAIFSSRHNRNLRITISW
jgi:hypothetical protein